MKKILLLFIAIGLLNVFATIVCAKEENEQISADLGMKLADAAWREPIKDSDWRGTDPATEKPISPPRISNLYKLETEKSKDGFLFFEFPANVYYDVNLELAVNIHTGDVWDTMYNCERLSSPELSQMQENIKNSLTAEEKKQYNKWHQIEPWDASTATACKMKQLDAESGEQLAELAYPRAGIGSPTKRNETFLIYQVLGKYEGTATWLAVNPWTGDVWNMDECKLLSNPALQKAQAKIKDQFSAKELKEYERLHSIKPYREYDLEPCP